MWGEAGACFERLAAFHPQRERIWSRAEECYRKGRLFRKAYRVRTRARSGKAPSDEESAYRLQRVSLFERLMAFLRGKPR